MAAQGFFRWLVDHHTAARVIVERKNYSREVANPELDQLTGRFGPPTQTDRPAAVPELRGPGPVPPAAVRRPDLLTLEKAQAAATVRSEELHPLLYQPGSLPSDAWMSTGTRVSTSGLTCPRGRRCAPSQSVSLRRSGCAPIPTMSGTSGCGRRSTRRRRDAGGRWVTIGPNEWRPRSPGSSVSRVRGSNWPPGAVPGGSS